MEEPLATTPADTAAAAADTDSSNDKPSAADQKIISDLAVVTESLDRCEGLLRPGGGDRVASTAKTPATLELMGFLEACAPRMVELVEAAAQGAVGEPVLMDCLQVNDRLTKALADIEAVELVEAETTEAALNDFLDGGAAAAPNAAATATAAAPNAAAAAAAAPSDAAAAASGPS